MTDDITNPYQSPMAADETDEESSRDDKDTSSSLSFKSAKRRCLAGLILLTFMGGVFDELVADYPAVDRILFVAESIIFLMLVIVWCQCDSRERSYKLGKPLRLLIFFLAFIGIPIYLLRTRGVRGLVSIALAAVFLVCLGFVEWLGCEITSLVW